MRQMERAENDLSKANQCRFFLFFLLFNEAINNPREEQVALSVARDPKLLPFLVRQFLR